MKTEQKIYACPMHPDVQQFEPGNCPKCGMKLTLLPDQGKATKGKSENARAPDR